jgi:hypothetical protein
LHGIRVPSWDSSSYLKDDLDGVDLRLKPGADSVAVAKIVTAILASTHREAEDFKVTIPAALLAQQKRKQTIFTYVMVAIAAISLLVGGIGIMNIVLATVMDRTREIGIRRAMEARGSSSAIVGVLFGIYPRDEGSQHPPDRGAAVRVIRGGWHFSDRTRIRIIFPARPVRRPEGRVYAAESALRGRSDPHHPGGALYRCADRFVHLDLASIPVRVDLGCDDCYFDLAAADTGPGQVRK